MNKDNIKRTAGEAGWHISRYNLYANISGEDKIAIVNLMRGSCGAYSPIELYLLNEVETLVEDHPVLGRFKKRGLIANYDETSALYAMGRVKSSDLTRLSLVICPTMACNFDCPYCFEEHRAGIMDQKVCEDVITLAERIMNLNRIRKVSVCWFGGEPLLGMDIITDLSNRLMALAGKWGADYEAGIITNGYLLTQEIVDTLASKHVKYMQVTLDGIGKTHDATRHLKGGMPTFHRIAENLRTLTIPFEVAIRQNAHSGNAHEVEKLKDFVARMAEESGNKLIFAPSWVRENYASFHRDERVETASRSDTCSISVAQAVKRFRPMVTHYCGAPYLFYLVIDENGRLYKCLENAGSPDHSFGTVSEWDPKRPFETADQPDMLSGFLNAALPLDDERCRECVWLPLCAGGCPVRRIVYGNPQCIEFRDDPERFVLELYQYSLEKKITP